MSEWTNRIVTADMLSQIADRSDIALQDRRTFNLRPSGEKDMLTMGVGEVSKLVGKSPTAIRNYYDPEVTSTPLPPLNRGPANHRIWDVSDVLKLMEHTGKLPSQKYVTEVGVKRLAIQTYKGGAGKSTIATHLTHYLAKRGYKVLLVDLDPQASSTTYNGFVPDFDIEAEETLEGLWSTDAFGVDGALKFDLKGRIRTLPNWPNVGLVPSNLAMQNAEWEARTLTNAHQNSNRPYFLYYLDEALKTVEDDYDLIIMDSPPSLGILSLSIIAAADAMVIPLLPTFTDIASTAQFLALLATAYDRWLPDKEMYWQRFLLNNVQKIYAHQYAEDWARDVWGGLVMRSTMVHSSEIASAAIMLRSVYELNEGAGSRSAFKRAISHADQVCSEIEMLITNTWAERQGAGV